MKKIKRFFYKGLQYIRWIPKDRRIFTKLASQINRTLLYALIKDVEGCVVECGVAEGEALAQFKILILSEGKRRKLYGYDTFKGLPPGLPHEHRAVVGDFGFNQEEVIQFFNDTNVPRDDVQLVEGNIQETLKSFKDPIAFLHIDVDLYEGYKSALDLLWDKITPGGVVLLDEYDQADWPGATQAVDEFIKKNNLTLHEAAFAHKFYLIK